MLAPQVRRAVRAGRLLPRMAAESAFLPTRLVALTSPLAAMRSLRTSSVTEFAFSPAACKSAVCPAMSFAFYRAPCFTSTAATSAHWNGSSFPIRNLAPRTHIISCLDQFCACTRRGFLVYLMFVHRTVESETVVYDRQQYHIRGCEFFILSNYS